MNEKERAELVSNYHETKQLIKALQLELDEAREKIRGIMNGGSNIYSESLTDSKGDEYFLFIDSRRSTYFDRKGATKALGMKVVNKHYKFTKYKRVETIGPEEK